MLMRCPARSEQIRGRYRPDLKTAVILRQGQSLAVGRNGKVEYSCDPPLKVPRAAPPRRGRETRVGRAAAGLLRYHPSGACYAEADWLKPAGRRTRPPAAVGSCEHRGIVHGYGSAPRQPLRPAVEASRQSSVVWSVQSSRGATVGRSPIVRYLKTRDL